MTGRRTAIIRHIFDQNTLGSETRELIGDGVASFIRCFPVERGCLSRPLGRTSEVVGGDRCDGACGGRPGADQPRSRHISAPRWIGDTVRRLVRGLWAEQPTPAKNARGSLNVPPRNFIFERRFRLTRGGNSWPASLRTPGSQHLIASFGWNQWSTPFWMTAERVPVRVYGDPARRSIVVVSCAGGVLAGRISVSRFGEQELKRPASPVVRWLFAPLRVPRIRR